MCLLNSRSVKPAYLSCLNVNRHNTDCVCVCFQWSPFQLSGHCPYNRANRPVVWSHTPRRYSTKHPAPDLFIFLSYLTLCVTTLFSSLFPVSSLQCCRAVVPSQLPRPVVFFPTGLMEWSSKIWGEPSNKLEQPCVWSDCFQCGHCDGRPCVCLRGALSQHCCGSEWRNQTRTEKVMLLLVYSLAWKIVLFLECLWQISKCTKKRIPVFYSWDVEDLLQCYISCKNLQQAVIGLGMPWQHRCGQQSARSTQSDFLLWV